MRKYITDYLKAHGEYAYSSETNGNFTLKLNADHIQFSFDTGWGREASICIPINQKELDIEDIISSMLERADTEIRFCEHCGKPIDRGFTIDEGGWYCCEDCFEDDMNEYYGEGKWRRTETGSGYYEHYNENFKDWWNTGIYYTEWY